MSEKSQIGVTGLAVMGANLARNIGRNGWSVAVHNRSPEKTRHFMEEYARRGRLHRRRVERGVRRRPRAPAQDHHHGQSRGAGRRGDRGARAAARRRRHPDRRRQLALPRHQAAHRRTARSAGCASSASASPAARRARCSARASCPAAPRRPTPRSRTIFTKIAAQVDGTPCCTFVGPDGAGHYVKMVHNGIEYADIQLITEAYDLMRNVAGLEVDEIAKTFEEWNEGDLESLPDRDHRQSPRQAGPAGRRAADRRDRRPGRAERHRPLDRRGRARAGRAADRDHRGRLRPRALVAERRAHRRLEGPRRARARARPRTGASSSTTSSTPSTRARSSPTRRASSRWRRRRRQSGWDLDLGAMATIWRGGCIIRARFLDRIKEAYDEGEVVNLLTVPYFRDAVATGEDGLAAGDRRGGRPGRRRPRLHLLARLLRRLPPRARAGRADPGPARLLRRPHLPAHRRRGQPTTCAGPRTAPRCGPTSSGTAPS